MQLQSRQRRRWPLQVHHCGTTPGLQATLTLNFHREILRPRSRFASFWQRVRQGLMPEATVVIVTRNRKEKAKAAIESALAQIGDVEVLVMDDGSTDGTADYVRQQFPQVQLFRSEQQVGYVVHRSDAARHAK